MMEVVYLGGKACGQPHGYFHQDIFLDGVQSEPSFYQADEVESSGKG